MPAGVYHPFCKPKVYQTQINVRGGGPALPCMEILGPGDLAYPFTPYGGPRASARRKNPCAGLMCTQATPPPTGAAAIRWMPLLAGLAGAGLLTHRLTCPLRGRQWPTRIA